MTRQCRLEAISGIDRACAEVRCSFWEPGGAVLEGRCMFERVDLSAWHSLVADLLEIRDRLDDVRDPTASEGNAD